ncbi:hypothetical protein DPM19_09040 [Actinomadura craniellae]|uniref:Lipoprotein n=1 Tax=Actinomadura craniellae TaxID=2231787 RepID=A0A365H9Y1_9ACTN|nr:hypothetical protein [Actinomadura craniellae]RAY15891.1 hypothetical protein DPM19_09040 [Actinomadura craniellae]
MKRMIVLLALAPLAACGGGPAGDGIAGATGETAASARPSGGPDAARIRWARCLRENGVDMPDDPKDLPPGGLRLPDRALQACEKHRDGMGGQLIDKNDPEVRDRFARFSRCMRQHGYDMPDDAPPDIHLKDPALWEKASRSCSHLLRENAPR